MAKCLGYTQVHTLRSLMQFRDFACGLNSACVKYADRAPLAEVRGAYPGDCQTPSQ